MTSNEVLLFGKRLQFDQTVAVRRGVNAPFPSALFGFNVALAPLADLGMIVRPVRHGGQRVRAPLGATDADAHAHQINGHHHDRA